MPTSILLNLGSGDLQSGFPRVTATLWSAEHPLPEQWIGKLPPAPHLATLYREWQVVYRSLCDRRSFRTLAFEDELEIDAEGVTNVSQKSFQENCQQIQEEMNRWLGSEPFQILRESLRSRLDPTTEIRVVLETNDPILRRIPWQQWNFFNHYPQAELALSQPEYQRRGAARSKHLPQKVRILAVLGSCSGIDVEAETRFLTSLQDADVTFLVSPSHHTFHAQLEQTSGWDILFFAGHSQTEGEIGRIYLNDDTTNNSLTLDQLKEALQTAIDNGLKLAIFNSCDGLGLALALERVHIPVVIVMREAVPNHVAQQFFNQFLAAFAIEKLSLYVAVRQARQQLQKLEDTFPGASWLPVICQNPAAESPTWFQLGGMPSCPYRGLFAFHEKDANLFFGRERVTQQLVKAVQDKALIAVVGASGSGKSSLVLAGLIPELRKHSLAPNLITTFRPGNNPFKALAEALLPLLKRPFSSNLITQLESSLRSDIKSIIHLVNSATASITSIATEHRQKLIVVADQFEELYTQTPEADSQLFLDQLLEAMRLCPALTIVLTLRADFYGYALSYRPFSDALQGAVYNLGPMNRKELQSVIESPAARMQVRLEQGLTEKLIEAAGEHPGRLPLLEFALTQLWSKQYSGWLTHEAYTETGGVKGALANHAENVYTQLKGHDRDRVQRIFLQLVQPGAGTDASRRLATRDEVGDANWDLISQLASARLVVTNCSGATSEETVEIAHEALIKSWRRLADWIDRDRDFRYWQEQLRVAIHQWESSDFDQSALLRGKALVDAQHWQQRRVEELSSREKNFIDRSRKLWKSEKQTQKRKRRLILYGLVIGLIVTSTLAAFAWREWRNSAISQISAIAESSQALFASNQTLDALKEAIRAKRTLQTLGGTDTNTQLQVESVLRRAVYGAVEFNRLEGHSGEVRGAVFSPDGSLFASTSTDKTVKLWKRDGTLLRTMEGHHAGVLDVAFSPDSQTLASASEDKTIKLWKQDGTLLKTLKGHNAAVTEVAFSPDGNTLVSASDDRTVKLWRLSGTAVLPKTLNDHQEAVKAVTFSRDGNTIVSASADNTIKLWKRDGTFLTTIARQNTIIWDVAISPKGNRIASANGDNTVKLWDQNGKLLKTLEGHQAPVSGVAFSPDGRLLASASWDNTVKVWNKQGTLLTTLNGHSDRVWRVTFSPDSKILASVSGDKSIKFWKLDNPLLTVLRGHRASVIGVAISPDGKMVASASDDGTVKLWTQDSTLPITLDHKPAVYGVAFSPDSQTIASAGSDSTVKLWNKDGALLKTLAGHKAGIWSVAFSPDGSPSPHDAVLASAGWDKTIKLWDKNGTELKTLEGHQESIWDVAFSPDDKTLPSSHSHVLASASGDMTVKLWNPDGTKLTTLKGHKAGIWGVAFSPDGNTIATASEDKSVKLWKRDGTLLTTLEGHQSIVFGVAFSPDGKLLASASADKTVKLWNVETSKPVLLVTLNGHSNRVWRVAFSPDSRTLASASEDKTVILWNLDRVIDLNQVLAAGCDWARDYLTTNPYVSESDRI